MQFDIRRFATVTSTMDVARGLAEAGAKEGTVVIADAQTAGRGRSTHAWYSPPGQSLYASIVLRPNLTPPQTGWVTMIAALAVAEGIREIRGWRFEITDDARQISTRSVQPPISNPRSLIPNPQSPISIKWFNDIHIGGRKVCGILVESSITGDRLDYVVLGIGLNVNTRFDDAPDDVRARATSLREAWGYARLYDRNDVLTCMLAQLEHRYMHLNEKPASPAPEYARSVETLGRDVRVNTGDKIVTGRAVRIDEDGALIVLTENGERRIGYGDVA